MKKILLTLNSSKNSDLVFATILAYIEKQIQDILEDNRIRISKLIDIIQLSKENSFLGMLLLIPDLNPNIRKHKSIFDIIPLEKNKEYIKPKYSAEQILNIIIEHNEIQNNKNIFKRLKKKKYIDSFLLKYLDHFRIKDLMKECHFYIDINNNEYLIDVYKKIKTNKLNILDDTFIINKDDLHDILLVKFENDKINYDYNLFYKKNIVKLIREVNLYIERNIDYFKYIIRTIIDVKHLIK